MIGGRYSGPWGFVGYAYDDLPSLLRAKVNEAFWHEGHQGGDLEALFHVMKRCGYDFGADDPQRFPRPVMGAGAEEYEEILAAQELMDGIQAE